jgi:hypothetical protein
MSTKKPTLDEVNEEFTEASRLGDGGAERLAERQRMHPDSSPLLAGGDVDAAWEQADVGEELVGGDNPTPDQDVVEELGAAMGITYNDGEGLHTTEKLEERDRKRWELDPASSEGYPERARDEAGTAKR